MSNLEVILGTLVALLIVVRLLLRFHRASALLSPMSIAKTIEQVLEPYLGHQLEARDLSALERCVQEKFVDAMTEHRLLIGPWQAVVRTDELLGPRCYILHPDGRELSVAAFEQLVRETREESKPPDDAQQ